MATTLYKFDWVLKSSYISLGEAGESRKLWTLLQDRMGNELSAPEFAPTDIKVRIRKLGGSVPLDWTDAQGESVEDGYIMFYDLDLSVLETGNYHVQWKLSIGTETYYSPWLTLTVVP